MFKKFQRLLALDYQNFKWSTVFWIFLLISFFIRFPFFFRDYVDRDESTFIIMGQSWVDGFLPYTQLWDLKPPITFLCFAVIIKIFGKSFIAIRAFGVLLVALTSLFSYGIASKITSKIVAFWIGVFCIFFLSLFGSLQGVMSEHICTFFLVFGVFLLLNKEKKYWFPLIGILFGLSVMSKLNMVYPVFFLGLFLLYKGYREKELKVSLAKISLLFLGFILIVALTAVPYLQQNILETWWTSIFEAPLAYSEYELNSRIRVLPTVFFFLGLLISGFVFKLLDTKSPQLQLLSVMVISILLSFIQAGRANGHYLIQVYPFILVPVGIGFSKISFLKNKIPKWTLLLLLVLIPMESYLEYANIISNKIKKGTFYNGEGIEVPQYILQHGLETKDIFFTEYHIGYWVLDVSPPTKAATHPSNITRDALFPFMNNPRETGMEELQFIMEIIQPKILVARKGKKIFDKKLEEYNEYIDSYLEKHYALLETIDRGLIYQRLE